MLGVFCDYRVMAEGGHTAEEVVALGSSMGATAALKFGRRLGVIANQQARFVVASETLQVVIKLFACIHLLLS